MLHEKTSELSIIWEEIVIPGATLEIINQRLERSQRRKKWNLVIIIGGICNFTMRIKAKKTRKLEYKDRKTEATKQAIEDILEHQGDIAQICTLTPANILKHNKVSVKGDSEEQKQLVSDIEELNQFIINKNIERDWPTIDLARQSYTASLKKQGNKKKRIQKFTDKELADGVHPTTHLKATWASYMAPVIVKILEKLSDKQKEESSSSESEDEELESWNFKRQHMH